MNPEFAHPDPDERERLFTEYEEEYFRAQLGRKLAGLGPLEDDDYPEPPEAEGGAGVREPLPPTMPPDASAGAEAEIEEQVLVKAVGRPRPDFDPRFDYPERYTDGPI